jgi:hypothetical protein
MRKKRTARSTSKTVVKPVTVKFRLKSGGTISVKAYRTRASRTKE